MYIFFDTETSDLPRNWNAPETDIRNWPRLVQLAWVAADECGKIVDSQVHLIKPEGFKIAAGAFARHGISTQFATENGSDLLPVLNTFLTAVNHAGVIIAHNIEFDMNIMGAELVRASISNPLRSKQLHCTMKGGTEFCRLPGSRGYKWPTLGELYSKLFHSNFDGAHDASADCLACMKCYFKLKEMDVMT